MKPGTKVAIKLGSGIDSGKTGVIMAWDSICGLHLRNEYPFVAGRTPESMQWVAVKFDADYSSKEHSSAAFPKTRLTKI